MHLLRVRVPDFRVLKDVDISFEKEFIPRVFPLGSQNGGGKSTLLQLIFALLHCSIKPERLPFLKNFLSGFEIPNGVDKRVLAIIDIWDGEKSVELEFFICKNNFVDKIADSQNDQHEEKTFTSLMRAFKVSEVRSSKFLQEKAELEAILNRFNSIPVGSPKSHGTNNRLSAIAKKNLIERLSKIGVTIKEDSPVESDFLKQVENWIRQDTSVKYQHLIRPIETLDSKNLKYITSFSLMNNQNEEDEVLLCHFKNIDIDKSWEFLVELSNKIYLAAPSTQLFLFLPQDSRKSLFRKQNNSKVSVYQENLGEANLKLNGLFTYDLLAVDILIDSFQLARDQDFKEAIETGEYGSNYKTLLNDLNTLVTNKYVNVTSDLTGITFKLDKPNGDIEIYPEDLSHGELKRLSIYMWLKHLDIKDAIVLMDEVDIALHPDWQFRIVGDLTEWASSNQYILATHSHELCQALTPSHVKVLEPRLTERRST